MPSEPRRLPCLPLRGRCRAPARRRGSKRCRDHGLTPLPAWRRDSPLRGEQRTGPRPPLNHPPLLRLLCIPLSSGEGAERQRGGGTHSLPPPQGEVPSASEAEGVKALSRPRFDPPPRLRRDSPLRGEQREGRGGEPRPSHYREMRPPLRGSKEESAAAGASTVGISPNATPQDVAAEPEPRAYASALSGGTGRRSFARSGSSAGSSACRGSSPPLPPGVWTRRGVRRAANTPPHRRQRAGPCP